MAALPRFRGNADQNPTEFNMPRQSLVAEVRLTRRLVANCCELQRTPPMGLDIRL